MKLHKQSVLHDKPKHWKIFPLKEVGTIVTGTTPKTSVTEYYGGEHLFVTPGDLNENRIVNNSETKLTDSGYQQTRPIPPNSVLFTSIGSTIGKTSIAGCELATNQQINAVITNENFNHDFLYNTLLFYKNYIKKLSGTQAVPILNKSSFENLRLPYPPLQEQIKIASILNLWDTVVSNIQELIQAKKRYNKGLMQQLLTGKKRFPENVKSESTFETRFGNYPKDWRYVRIGEFAKEMKVKNGEDDAGFTVLSCTKYDGLVDSLEYFDRQVFSDDLSGYKVVRKGYFAYATNHIEEGSIGYNDWCDKGLISPMYTVFQTDNEVVNDRYLFGLFKTEKYRHIFEVNTNGTVNRRGSLRWKEFSKIKVPLPPIEEQNRIAKLFDSIDNEVSLLKKELSAFKNQKKGLMQQLLTGKVRVNI